MKKKNRVAFIGAGEIGSALAALVMRAGACVAQWDADVSKVPDQSSLQEVVSQSEVLFFCVPSWSLRAAIKSASPYLNHKTICVFVSKGIEAKSKLFIDGFAKDALPKHQPFVLLSGPMLAEELEAGLGGAACVATKSITDFKKIQEIFSPKDLVLTFAPDTKSVAIAGVLKNVYAIAYGIASGLKWGDNKKGWLCVEVVQEMISITAKLKGDPSYILSQAGLGDLIATGSSKYSSNHMFGRSLVADICSERKGEGCTALPSLLKLLGLQTVKSLPILLALERIIQKKKNAKEEFEKLFS